MKNKPYLVKLEKDKNYAWCECAESNNQPFCDGSHNKVKEKFDNMPCFNKYGNYTNTNNLPKFVRDLKKLV